MIDRKSVVIAVVLLAAMAIAFGLPKAKYKSTDILNELAIPMTLGSWQGSNVKNDLKLMDEQYNFIQALDLREYRHPVGRQVYLYVLDAGNFHNPKVCMTSAGFVTRELNDITYDLSLPFTAAAITIAKDKSLVLISYWITINGKRVGWMEQKATEFWFSLIGKRKAGLMVRIDTPTSEQDIPMAIAAVQDFVRSFSAAVNARDHQYIFGF